VYRHNERIGKVTVIGIENLFPVNISSDDIPGMIDEVPILSLVCSYANGTSTISGLDELRHKESNRLEGIFSILTTMGVDIKISGDKVSINGKNKLYNTNKLNNYSDHRLAMMISIAQLMAGDKIEYPDCINISFPNFKELLNKVVI
jgi:3-phosphoshikimate 1-carboxyvinyltransferase